MFFFGNCFSKKKQKNKISQIFYGLKSLENFEKKSEKKHLFSIKRKIFVFQKTKFLFTAQDTLFSTGVFYFKKIEK